MPIHARLISHPPRRLSHRAHPTFRVPFVHPTQELAALLAIEQEKKRARKAKARSVKAPDAKGKDHEDNEQEEDEEEEEEEHVGIYNTEALHDKLEDIAWSEEQPWAETLAITSAQATHVDDVDDDLERELAFYNQAMDGAKQAIQRFEKAGVRWQRPGDYYAEMVKSDEHMARVKEQLLYEQKVIEEAEQRRKDREAKRYGKQVAAEKKKERAQDKKRAIDGVSALRKHRAREGFAGDLDVDGELARLDEAGKKPKGKLGERFSARDKQQSGKRAARDAKYGFGGRKRLNKQNDAYSAAGGEYKRGRFDDGFEKKGGARRQSGGGGGGFGGKGNGKKSAAGANKRPGKTRRQAMKRRG
jgi:rRNA-processing protein EBP2